MLLKKENIGFLILISIITSIIVLFLAVLPSTVNTEYQRNVHYAYDTEFDYVGKKVEIKIKELKNTYILKWFIYSDNGTEFSWVKEYQKPINIDSVFNLSIRRSKYELIPKMQ